ncbi:MAG TPA: hypothetical protein VH352_08865 [Pseudonocardiaceae bacterium]|jgi:hypothetical protein|nr:hypothetical protein [Pseudonocardiaceae bacterium]
MASFDPARVSKAEWIGLGAGLVAFIASFLPWYEFSATGILGGIGYSWNAWSLGFAAWFPLLLLVAAAGLMLAQQMGVNVPAVKPSWPLILLGVAVLALVIILLRWLTLPGGSDGLPATGITYGAGFGLYVGIVASILFGLSQYLLFKASGQSFSDVTKQLRGPGANPAPPTM